MPSDDRRKKKIPIDSVKNIEGTWILQEELSLPFTPLIRTLDPSGLLTERPHIIVENYAYFSSEFRLKRIDDEKWKDWDSISEHYRRIFQELLDQKEKSDMEMLKSAVQSYRNAVESYMNVNWFLYRKASYQELIDVLKEKFENYQDVFFRVMHSIDTINTNKRKDFIKLLQNKGSSDFKEKKTLFLKNMVRRRPIRFILGVRVWRIIWIRSWILLANGKSKTLYLAVGFLTYTTAEILMKGFAR